ncbi:hypothetical protein P691DRAFT_678842 [Macrolepiota fuliginosa MF-IS2]|uniref:Uncharacterized protein n=1 Tax=Macrolepiota fuliginosa MF-IS2 TaxID=1400762 RepID=A0A9P5X495_9AGAR|nr:hypothetical protein P691DRAFT_678842 [Macrolepiota fuliginosa MF-IS2]
MRKDCSTTLPYTIRFIKTTWLVGCILSGVCYGILILLGYFCFIALRNRDDGNARVNKGLAAYILLTILVGTIAEVLDIMVTINGILDESCKSEYLQLWSPYIGRVDIVFLAINLITDGLLIWRCYAIAKGLRRKACIALWSIPFLVYVGMVVTGVILTMTLSTQNQTSSLGKTLILLQFGISLFLNTLISLYIILLLLQQRRLMVQTFGRDGPLPYIDVLTVLVESAGLILVIDTFAICTIAFSPLGNVAFQLWLHLQPIASLLIIHRVSRGTDYFSKKVERKDSLRFSIVVPPSPQEAEDVATVDYK